MSDACRHEHRDDRGICAACGDCLHEIVLNGACLYCGSTDLDPIARSPKKEPFVPADRLRRR